MLSSQTRGDWIELSAAGSWTAEYAGAIEPQVEAATRTVTADIAINIARIDYLDTYGAWLLERRCETGRTRGVKRVLSGCARITEASSRRFTPEHRRCRRRRQANSMIATLESVGMTMASVGSDLVMLAQMIGSLMVAVARVIRRPTSFRFTSMVHQLERVGWRAVPIVI